MSHLATPAKRPPDSTPGPAAVALVSAAVFGMTLLVLGYAARQGERHDEQVLAAEAQELVQRGEAREAQVVRAGGASQAFTAKP